MCRLCTIEREIENIIEDLKDINPFDAEFEILLEEKDSLEKEYKNLF